ncbi:Transcription factor DYT1 [Camellia lanceoleosa]|uniref:Transcription factor DYT1 n=1 Tax=Camellia lanceoleosa TaxID=1840588 RepID=A0ACC0GDY4_9ERIC|nr:Transcription factor DYT1 [Camellia lanceoleosa]
MNSAFDDLSMNEEEENSNERMARRFHIDEEGPVAYKSKNLVAERKRRQKLSDRLLELRSLVPIITNMNKATIIIDAIRYVGELQKCVGDLSNQLLQMEAASVEEPKMQIDAINAAEEMKKWGIEPEVKVTQIDGYKLWIKLVYEKKRGGFTRLMETMSVLGYEFTDTSVTTSKGAFVITACLEGINGGMLEAEQIRELLLEITRSM